MSLRVALIVLFTCFSTAIAQRPAPPSTRQAFIDPIPNQPEGITPLGDTGKFVINFRNATIDTVLYELARAFGFSVIQVSPIGNERIASIVNLNGVTEPDAITLINIALSDLGYAAVRKGNVLQIHRRAEAMTQDIPVRRFESPDDVPLTDQLMTAVLPLRSVNATQLAQELRPLINQDASITADPSANSLIVTDVTSTIHRVASIVAELDSSVSEARAVRIMKLDHANAADVARIINDLFRPARPETPNNPGARGTPDLTTLTGARRGERNGRGG